MILHASVVADRPRDAAETLASLLGGVALPIGPGPGTWTAVGPDPIGNVISVLKRGLEFHRVAGDHLEVRRGVPVRHTGFHLLIETELSEDEVLELGRQRDCHVHRAAHGAFDVIEFWVEDSLLIEVVTAELGQAYRKMTFSDELRSRFRPIVEAGLALDRSQPL